MSSRIGRLASLFVMMLMAVVLACGVAVAATISGDTGPNTIMGTAEADSLYGYGGDDHMSGGSAADRLFGGDGNDELFGTDKYQTGVADGNQTSVDGNDRVEGEKGDDTVVGASGADTLRGGPGADTIVDGPANDLAQDLIEADPTYFSTGPPPESDAWNDKINVLNEPAAKDTVNCGPGTDEVQADPLDVVNANCESVEVVDPANFDKPTIDPATGEAPPTVVSSDELGGTPGEPDLTDGGYPATGNINAEGTKIIYCWSPGYYKAVRWCGRKWVGYGQRLGVGVRWTKPNPWIYFYAWDWGSWVGRTADIHESYDTFDLLMANDYAVNGTTVDAYTENGNRWKGAEFSGWLENY